MKEKLLQLKEKMMQNKKMTAIIAVVAVAVIVIAIVACAALLGDDEKSKKSATGSSGNLVKNETGKSDKTDGTGDKDSKDETEDGTGENESDTTTGEENGEQATTDANGETSAEGSSEGNASGSNSGNSGTTGGTTGGSSSGSSTSGSTGGSGGNSTGSSSTGGSTGGSSSGSTGGSGSTSGNTSSSTGSSGSSSSSSVVGVDTPQANQNTIYNQLFDINNKITIKFEISDSEMQKLQADYKKYGSNSSIYRKADKMIITIGNNTYEIYEVGIRLKGNSSRVEPLVNGNINARNLVHFKISFKQTFDDSIYGSDAKVWSSEAARKERKNRTFAGLEGFELKWNRNLDSTYTCNYYANQMFRDLLGYGQNTTLCNLNLGSFNYGVYTLYEPVDEKFIARYFPNEQGGDLYKCGWSNIGATYTTSTLNSIGIEPDNSSTKYVYDLKTNKKTSNHASLKNLINKLNSNPSASTFSSLVDVDRWTKFAAVSYFTGNPDDMRNNYNNHYVYFLASGKAVFIPYDYDRCLGVTRGCNPDGSGMTATNPFSEYAKLANQSQANPLFKYSVIRKDGSIDGNYFSSQYKTQLANVANSKWLNYNTFYAAYQKFYANYASVAIPSSGVRAYVQDRFDGSVNGVHTSSLGFAESGNGNMSVRTYFNSIITTYKNSLQ